MKIHFQRSGGLEGIVTDLKIDTDSISPEESSKLEKLINESNFFDLPEHIPTKENAADYFTYKISIENQTKKHSIERNDFSLEGKLHPLIDYLRNKQT
jgi:hypothetical protein